MKIETFQNKFNKKEHFKITINLEELSEIFKRITKESRKSSIKRNTSYALSAASSAALFTFANSRYAAIPAALMVIFGLLGFRFDANKFWIHKLPPAFGHPDHTIRAALKERKVLSEEFHKRHSLFVNKVLDTFRKNAGRKVHVFAKGKNLIFTTKRPLLNTKFSFDLTPSLIDFKPPISR